MAKKLFLNDKFILILILINAIIIFTIGFAMPQTYKFGLHILDNLITALFIIELWVKFRAFGVKGYFKSNWNKFDFILIILSIPALIAFILNTAFSDISFLLIFRVMRAFKSFRFLKFIPGIEHLMLGVQRALKASVIILIAFVIYIFIIGIFSFYIFQQSAPEFFGNPLTSLYSTFKIFTIEGWFAIPERISQSYNSVPAFFIHAYFIFVLLTGGIFGLSMVNSIFVDAMVSDNNDDLEKKIDDLDRKITELIAMNHRNNLK